jgi:hypothetical protein
MVGVAGAAAGRVYTPSSYTLVWSWLVEEQPQAANTATAQAKKLFFIVSTSFYPIKISIFVPGCPGLKRHICNFDTYNAFFRAIISTKTKKNKYYYGKRGNETCRKLLPVV